MPLRVYLTYGAREDQVIALRLQVLAEGMEVFVPPAFTRSGALDQLSARRLLEAELVLGILATPLAESATFLSEIEQAKYAGKSTLVLVHPAMSNDPVFVTRLAGVSLVKIDPEQPALTDVVMETIAQTSHAEALPGLLALAVVAFGLILFAHQE